MPWCEGVSVVCSTLVQGVCVAVWLGACLYCGSVYMCLLHGAG